MRVGGPARFFCVVKTIDELERSIYYAKENKLSFFILGGGSNIIVKDKGFNGLVIKIEIKGIEIIEEENNTLLIASAGEVWDDIVLYSVEKGLYGIENLSAIPGTVGAAPIQNIGAYGVEVCETLQWVEVFNTKEMKMQKISNPECKFRYRSSIFKKEKGKHFIVTRVSFSLKKEGKVKINYKDVREYFRDKNIKNPSLYNVRNAIIAIRSSKLPNLKEVGTVGSFFKNPIINNESFKFLKEKYPDIPSYPVDDSHVKIPLAWILDVICSLKGLKKMHIGLYKNQPLILIHFGGGTAQEIDVFAEEIEEMVREKTKIKIEREAVFI